MKHLLALLLLTVISVSCTTLKDQAKLTSILESKQADFNSLAQAHAKLPCIPFNRGDDAEVFTYGPGDKVVQLGHSKSYIKKFCFNEKTFQIIVTGRHVGGGQGKSFYTVPAFVAFSFDKEIKAEYKMRQTFMAGHLEFTMNAVSPFDSMVVYLDTDNIDSPFGGHSSTMVTNPLISIPVHFYKYPEGEIGISLR